MRKIILITTFVVATSTLFTESFKENLGWQIAPLVDFSMVNDKFTTMLGGEVGANYKNWFLGGAVYRTVTSNTLDTLSYRDDIGYRFIFPLDLLYGGGILGYRFDSGKKFTPVASLLVGGGAILLDSVTDYVFIVKPKVGLNYTITKNIKLNCVIGYRSVFYSEWIDYGKISGATLGIYLKFGLW